MTSPKKLRAQKQHEREEAERRAALSALHNPGGTQWTEAQRTYIAETMSRPNGHALCPVCGGTVVESSGSTAAVLRYECPQCFNWAGKMIW